MSKVSNKFLAQVPADTLKGNNTGSTANVTDLTVSQVQTMLSIPTSSSPLSLAAGGTGTSAASANAAFDALSPMTTAGDIIYENATPTAARLGIGTTGQVLTVSSGFPAWATPTNTGTVTSVAMTVPSFLSVSGSPITTSGTLALTLSGTALPVANGGTGDTSFTAYAVITGGTTSTGALQSVSGVGTSGQVLTSNGASALPTWQTASASASLSSTSYSQITASTLNTASPGALMIYQTLQWNDFSGSYSTTTGLFTVPNTGRYLICVQSPTFTGFSSGEEAYVSIQINGTGLSTRISPRVWIQSSSSVASIGGSAMVALTAGQTVGFIISTDNQSILSVNDGSQSVAFFSITQVH
jgi:hypothetical protein